MIERPAWLTGIINKRPETVLILHALIIKGRRVGHVTAEDAHNIHVTHPNCRGAAMKLLADCGFNMDPTPIKGSTKQSHGHWLHKWTLVNQVLAESILEALKDNLCKRELLQMGLFRGEPQLAVDERRN